MAYAPLILEVYGISKFNFVNYGFDSSSQHPFSIFETASRRNTNKQQTKNMFTKNTIEFSQETLMQITIKTISTKRKETSRLRLLFLFG